jgi:simple sugar transport system substrate-binding protein
VTAEEPSPSPSLKFVFISTCIAEDFFTPVRRGMHDAAGMLGVECHFTGTPEVDIPAQVRMVDDAILAGVDGIALNIIHPEAFNEVVDKALNADIPVVAFNVDAKSTSDGSVNRRLSAVCQNLYEAGRILGRNALSFMTGGDKILMTVHSKGISALEDRLRGIQDVISEIHVTWKVITTGIEVQKAAIIVAEELKADSSIRNVFCTGQADTEGAGLAVQKYYPEMGYHVAGFDLSPNILHLIKDGHIAFTIDQQPYMQGFYPVIQLTLYCRYGLYPADIDTGAALVTKANVDDIILLANKGVR